MIPEEEAEKQKNAPRQLNLFEDYEAVRAEEAKQQTADDKERRMQEALLEIKSKYGKNAILKGVSLKEEATAKERNEQIGGHHA